MNMDRREFLKAAGVGAAAALFPGCATGARRQNGGAPPNVVLFLIDDLGWADLGCYGSTYYETPRLDRLAREGTRFTDGYAACAVCSPTRAAVITGRYPARIGVTDWIRARYQRDAELAMVETEDGYVAAPGRALLCPRNPYWMALDEVTLAEVLRARGYVTCHAGKWHLGDEAWFPERQGFDVNIGGCDFGHPPSYFDPYCSEHQGCIHNLPPRKEGEYLTDRLADEAARFIREHAESPFFLHMAHYAVHTPIQAKEATIAKYREKPPTHQTDPVYAAMVESMDEAVGTVLDAIEDAGVADNTLVIFTSDNGGLIGKTSNAPLRAGKGTPYEGGVRVPLLVRWPGRVPAGALCDTPASSIDLLPTVCAAVNVPPPEGRVIDGTNLLPVLTDGARLDRDALFWHFPHYRDAKQGPYSIVRTGDWKLIRWYEGPHHELYRLDEDPSETRDLAADQPAKCAALSARLDAWLAETGAKLPRAT